MESYKVHNYLNVYIIGWNPLFSDLEKSRMETWLCLHEYTNIFAYVPASGPQL